VSHWPDSLLETTARSMGKPGLTPVCDVLEAAGAWERSRALERDHPGPRLDPQMLRPELASRAPTRPRVLSDPEAAFVPDPDRLLGSVRSTHRDGHADKLLDHPDGGDLNSAPTAKSRLDSRARGSVAEHPPGHRHRQGPERAYLSCARIYRTAPQRRVYGGCGRRRAT
jgi:hypothetical protein